MPYLHKNFIVFGPGGRCGSHWVETTLKNLFGVAHTHTIGPFTMLPNGWIFHTNGSTTDLLEMHSAIRNSTTLIYCVRKNYFNSVISFLVAEITDEWNAYTSKTVEPFVVDTVRFQTLINDFQYDQTITIPRDILPLFNNLITIEFEDLISSAIPEKYVADQLGIDYDLNYQQSDSVSSNKNTRNYKELILNWDELVDIYKVFSAGHHTQ
jgi:hypothetical protein